MMADTSNRVNKSAEGEGYEMKINPIGTSGVNPYNRQVNKVETAKTTALPKDKVEISASAKEMQQVSQISAQRQTKLDELKSQIENGTYKMNASDTAKSILDFYSNK